MCSSDLDEAANPPPAPPPDPDPRAGLRRRCRQVAIGGAGVFTVLLVVVMTFVLVMGLYPAPFGVVLHESVNEILRLAAPGRKLLIGL